MGIPVSLLSILPSQADQNKQSNINTCTMDLNCSGAVIQNEQSNIYTMDHGANNIATTLSEQYCSMYGPTPLWPLFIINSQILDQLLCGHYAK